MEKGQIQSLVERLMAGDDSAFEALYSGTVNALYGYGRTLESNEALLDDAIQETYIKIYRKLDTLKSAQAFLPWARTILRNEIFGQRRGVKETTVAPVTDDEGHEMDLFDNIEETEESYLPGFEMEAEAIRDIVDDSLEDLSDVQRRTVVLYYYDECSVQDIAKIMDCSEGTVKSRLNSSRNRMRKGLESYERKHDVALHGALPFALIAGAMKDSIEGAKVTLAAGKSAALFSNIAQGIGGPVAEATAAAAASAAATATTAGAATAGAATAGAATVGTATAVTTGTVTTLGAGKVIAIGVAGVLAVGGGGYGISQAVSNDAPDPVVIVEESETLSDEEKAEILGTYTEYFAGVLDTTTDSAAQEEGTTQEEGAAEEETMDSNGVLTIVDMDQDGAPEYILYSLPGSEETILSAYHKGRIIDMTVPDGTELLFGSDGSVYTAETVAPDETAEDPEQAPSEILKKLTMERRGFGSEDVDFLMTDDMISVWAAGESVGDDRLLAAAGTAAYLTEFLNGYGLSIPVSEEPAEEPGEEPADAEETTWQQAYDSFIEENGAGDLIGYADTESGVPLIVSVDTQSGTLTVYSYDGEQVTANNAWVAGTADLVLQASAMGDILYYEATGENGAVQYSFSLPGLAALESYEEAPAASTEVTGEETGEEADEGETTPKEETAKPSDNWPDGLVRISLVSYDAGTPITEQLGL